MAQAGLTIIQGQPPANWDPFHISEWTIVGDTLELTVNYGGGCKAHEFALYWDGSFLESAPPQVRLTLSHNANGDLCEALPSETLRFDLRSLSSSWPSEIVVRVVGSDTMVSYVP